MGKPYEPSLLFRGFNNDGKLSDHVSQMSDSELKDAVRKCLSYKRKLNKRILSLNKIRKAHREMRAIVYAEAEKRFEDFKSTMPWKLR